MVAAACPASDAAQSRPRSCRNGDLPRDLRNDGDIRRRVARTRIRDRASDRAIRNCEQLWIVCCYDDHAPGDYGTRLERRSELAGLRIRVQTRTAQSESAVGGAAPAAA